MYGDPANLQTFYHATSNPDLRFIANRPIKNYNQIGSWFTNDPVKARQYYGEYVYEIQAFIRNPLIAETEDFDKFFYNPSIAPKYLKMYDKDKNMTKYNITREDMTDLMSNPRYVREFRNALISQGYDAIVWRDSTIDLIPNSDQGRHTVTILLFPADQVRQQRLMSPIETEGVSNLMRSAIIKQGRLLVKKAQADVGQKWITISGNHVLINGKGEILQGPSGLKGKTLNSTKKQSHEDTSWESKKLTPFDTKEVVEAREDAKKQTPTFYRESYNSPERVQLRRTIAKKLYGDGAKNKNRRIDIVIGPPAAGKSTVLADPLAKEHGSLIIDSDMAKEMLPEFEGGRGAGVVHEESAMIIEGRHGVFHRALRNGDNIVLPMVGRSTNKLVQMRDELNALGYEVHLHLNELPKEKAAQRAVARFYSNGRFVDPNYVYNVVGDKPSEVYENLKKIGGFHSYEKYSNDVEKGTKPKLIEKHGADAGKGSRRSTNGSTSGHAEGGEKGKGKQLVVKKNAKADEKWLTINGNHVMINGNGDIIKGPAHLKGKHLLHPDVHKQKSPEKSESSDSHSKEEKPKDEKPQHQHASNNEKRDYDPAVDRIYKQQAKHEPEISATMKDVAKSVGAKLEGFDFRLKTQDSYHRKVQSDLKEEHAKGNKLSPTEVANNIKDAVRYTVMTHEDNLTDSYNKTVKELESKGYSLKRTKNSWFDTKNPYRGINSIFTSPEGVNFEVQFHTPESFDMKQNRIHHLYEEYRNDNTSEERKHALHRQMMDMSETLNKPKNIHTIEQFQKHFRPQKRLLLRRNML